MMKTKCTFFIGCCGNEDTLALVHMPISDVKRLPNIGVEDSLESGI